MPIGSDGQMYQTDGSIYGYQAPPGIGGRLKNFAMGQMGQQQGPQFVSPQGVDPSGSVLGTMPQDQIQGGGLLKKGVAIGKLFGL
jgi:hypothetical protein